MRTYWGMPAKDWIAADPEFWKPNPMARSKENRWSRRRVAEDMPSDQPKSDLRGKVALVTGGSRGEGGRGIAEELGALGATVYVTGRRIEQVDLGPGCISGTCDHTNDDQVRAVVDRIVAERYRIDILVNNVWGGYERMFEHGEYTWTLPFWRQSLWRWRGRC